MPDEQNNAITIQGCSFTWDMEKEREGSCLLEDITMMVKRGQLLSVIGKIGSGKTTLLLSILGETVSSLP